MHNIKNKETQWTKRPPNTYTSIYKVSDAFVIIVAGDDDRLLNKSLFYLDMGFLK